MKILSATVGDDVGLAQDFVDGGVEVRVAAVGEREDVVAPVPWGLRIS